MLPCPPRRQTMKLLCWLMLLTVIPVSQVLGTSPAPDPEPMNPTEWEDWLSGGPEDRLPMPPSLGPWNYVREFNQMVDFFAFWQLFDPDSSNHGGMIEAEAGPLGNVIQTDNTLEAIWCWSRFREFTGRDTYDVNTEAAWIYCRNFPAWMEEGGGQDYYRVHNCAWGLTAVLMYEAATGDMSYSGYADTCAQYIVDHPLNIYDGTVWQQRLDSFVKGWAAGNLYLFGEARGNATLMAEAVTQGTDVFNWLNSNPQVNLTLEYWAMSSGTSMWGVCNSVFRDDPVLGQTWCAANAGYMDVWQEWYSVPGYDWDSSWNVAYCNAHFAVWDVTGDDTYWNNGALIADLLLSLDTDDDGGIVANTHDPVTEDMTWVSCYLVKMGVDRLMGSVSDHDTGTLRFVGINDGETFEVDTPIPVRVIATNYGLNDESGVELHLAGDAGSDMAIVDLDFAELDSTTFVEDWLPGTVGSYTLTAWTEMAGDADATNDTISVTFDVTPVVGVPNAGDPAGPISLVRATPNPFQASVVIHFNLETDSGVMLELFDLNGRLVRRIDAGRPAAGNGTIAWDGRDTDGRTVAPGLYPYRLSAGNQASSGKIVKVR